MTIWEIAFGWESGRKEPETAGWYYVAKNRSGRIYIDTYEWSPYGWNTSETARENPIDFETEFWWTPAIKVVEEAKK